MRDPTDSSIDLASVMSGSELVGLNRHLPDIQTPEKAFDSDVKHTIWITDASLGRSGVGRSLRRKYGLS